MFFDLNVTWPNRTQSRGIFVNIEYHFSDRSPERLEAVSAAECPPDGGVVSVESVV
jgi:hypothetical protein